MSAAEAVAKATDLLQNPPPGHPYTKGTWGPDTAAALTADDGGWYGPWVP